MELMEGAFILCLVMLGVPIITIVAGLMFLLIFEILSAVLL